MDRVHPRRLLRAVLKLSFETRAIYAGVLVFWLAIIALYVLVSLEIWP